MVRSRLKRRYRILQKPAKWKIGLVPLTPVYSALATMAAIRSFSCPRPSLKQVHTSNYFGKSMSGSYKPLKTWPRPVIFLHATGKVVIPWT